MTGNETVVSSNQNTTVLKTSHADDRTLPTTGGSIRADGRFPPPSDDPREAAQAFPAGADTSIAPHQVPLAAFEGSNRLPFAQDYLWDVLARPWNQMHL